MEGTFLVVALSLVHKLNRESKIAHRCGCGHAGHARGRWQARGGASVCGAHTHGTANAGGGIEDRGDGCCRHAGRAGAYTVMGGERRRGPVTNPPLSQIITFKFLLNIFIPKHHGVARFYPDQPARAVHVVERRALSGSNRYSHIHICPVLLSSQSLSRPPPTSSVAQPSCHIHAARNKAGNKRPRPSIKPYACEHSKAKNRMPRS